MEYLRRKLEPEVQKTPLDILIAANAYGAEVYVYSASLGGLTNFTEFRFQMKGIYNFNLPNGKKRPKWVLVEEQNTGRWYPITNHILSEQSYFYQQGKWGSLLIERLEKGTPIEMIN